jgi:hypothetical protein
VATELVALAWQPVGGGNSIAVCGLAGALAVASWRADERLLERTPQAVLVWCGAVLATLFAPLVLLGIAGAALTRAGQERDRPVGRPTAVAVVATGSVLALATDIHGAALLAGTALALVTTDRDGRPRRAPVRRHL